MWCRAACLENIQRAWANASDAHAGQSSLCVCVLRRSLINQMRFAAKAAPRHVGCVELCVQCIFVWRESKAAGAELQGVRANVFAERGSAKNVRSHVLI
jgi:hypothetical protein